jgi:hypothetical protein
METQIAQKVEGSISSIGNVRNITTFIVEGQVNIFLQFEIGTPIDRAVTDVRDAVAKVRNDLPQGIFEPQVTRQNVDGGAFAYYAVTTTSLTPTQLSWFIDNTVTKRLLAVPGVAQVSRSGGVDREIRVELDPAACRRWASRPCRSTNNCARSIWMPRAAARRSAAASRRSGCWAARKTAEALGDTEIIIPAASRCVCAKSPWCTTESPKCAPWRGSTAAGHDFRRVQGQGRFGCHGAKAVQAELDKILKAENPAVHMTTISPPRSHHPANLSLGAQRADRRVDTGGHGGVVFPAQCARHGDFRAGHPLSAIPTFAFMQWMGFTLNQITLLGLSLVAGVLVDDAIVEIENIVRHMRMGKSCFQAAIDAADEIGLAVVATSFTIIAVFLPVSFMGGISGQYFKQFGLTVAAAVFISLMVARLITPCSRPMRCAAIR